MPRTYQAEDHAGKRYGSLTGVKFVRFGSSRNRIWLFDCDCGNEREAIAGHVTAGVVRSCGCESNPLASRISKLRQYYKLSLEDAQEWAARALGTCDICAQPETVVQNGKIKPLALDHCHQRKIVRGVLCSRCNIMLGYYEKHAAFPSKIECFDSYLGKMPWERMRK